MRRLVSILRSVRVRDLTGMAMGFRVSRCVGSQQARIAHANVRLHSFTFACRHDPLGHRRRNVSLSLEGLRVRILLTGYSQDYVERIVVITDPRPSPATHCGVGYNEFKCVIINPGGGPAIVTTIGMDVTKSVSAGDRFTVTSQIACDGRLDLTLLED